MIIKRNFLFRNLKLLKKNVDVISFFHFVKELCSIYYVPINNLKKGRAFLLPRAKIIKKENNYTYDFKEERAFLLTKANKK